MSQVQGTGHLLAGPSQLATRAPSRSRIETLVAPESMVAFACWVCRPQRTVTSTDPVEFRLNVAVPCAPVDLVESWPPKLTVTFADSTGATKQVAPSQTSIVTVVSREYVEVGEEHEINARTINGMVVNPDERSASCLMTRSCQRRDDA